MIEQQNQNAMQSAKPARRLPKFQRQNVSQKKRVARSGWRKPRGIDNKLRIKKKGFGFLPKIGFRTQRAFRALHPTGLKEVLVNSLKDLGRMSGIKGIAVRISGSVGKKKRIAIVAEAKKMQLRILNE